MSADQDIPGRDNGDLIRIIIDTSALIRYLIRPSAALRELIEVLWLGDRVEMVTCPELLAELEEVLQRNYIRAVIQADDADALLDAIWRKAEVLPAVGAIPSYTRDSKDDKFIACAIAGHVRYVVTVDKDLLDMETFLDIRLWAPRAFIAWYQGGCASD